MSVSLERFEHVDCYSPCYCCSVPCL